MEDSVQAPAANLATLERRLAESVARAERDCRLSAVVMLEAAGDPDPAAHALLELEAGPRGCVLKTGSTRFAVVLDDVASNHEAHERAGRVLKAFEERFACAGFSIFPFTARSPRALIDAAADAMCEVKRRGQGGIETARPQVPRRDTSKIHPCAISFAAKPRSARRVSGSVSG